MPNIPLSGDLLPIAIVLMLAMAVFWVLSFVSLMSLPDDKFPGPFVRFGWVAAFVLVLPLAPFGFALWQSRTASKRVESMVESKRKERRDAAFPQGET